MLPLLALFVPSLSLVTATPPQPPHPSFFGYGERDAWAWHHHHSSQQGPHQGQADIRNMDYRQDGLGNRLQHFHQQGNQTGYPWMAGRHDGHPPQAGQPAPPPPTGTQAPFYLPQPPPPPPPLPPSSAPALPGPQVPANMQSTFYSHPFGQNHSHQHSQPHFHHGPQGALNNYPQHSNLGPLPHQQFSYHSPPNQSYPVLTHQPSSAPQNPRVAPSLIPTAPAQGSQLQNARQPQSAHSTQRPPRLQVTNEGRAGESDAEHNRRGVASMSRDRARNHSSPHLGTSRRERVREADRSRRAQLPSSPIVSRRRNRPPVPHRRDEEADGRRQSDGREHGVSHGPADE